jgi:O-antigen/teichoic acid export membrane protein
VSRGRRAVRTLLAGYAATATTVLLGLFATPYIYDTLGEDRYGAFRVATDYLAYVLLLELGIGGALQVALARALGEGRPDRVAALVRAGLRAYLGCAALMAVVTVGLIAAAPWLIPVPARLAPELRVGLLIALTGLAFFPLGVFRPLTEAAQRGYVVHGTVLLQSVLTTGLAVVLAWAGWGLPGQFAAVLGAAVTASLVLTGSAVWNHPELRRRTPPDPSAWAELWRLNWPTLGFGLLARVAYLTDAVWVALLVGLKAVAPYALTTRLPALVGVQLAAVSSASWAALADLYHRGEREVLADRFMQLTRGVAWVGLAVLVPVAAGNRAFVRLWVGPDADAGPLVTALAVGNAWMMSVLSLWGWMFLLTGRVHRLLGPMAIGVGLNLAVTVAACRVVGSAGPLVGIAAQLAGVSGWWYARLLRAEFGFNLRTLFAAAFRPLAVAAPYAAALIALAAAYPPDQLALPRWAQWAVLLGGMAAAALGYLVLGWFAAIPVATRWAWVRTVRAALSRG